jgi:hypothetical protein
MKSLTLLLLTVCLFNAFELILAAQDAPDKQENQVKSNKSPFQNMAETTFPGINNIKFKKPAAGQPCSVQVDITANNGKIPANITAVKLIYYINGNLEKPNEILMNKGKGQSYTASIPEMKSGTKVDFIIRAEDSNGNVATQAIPSADNLVSSIADDDNPSESIADNLDLLGMSAGYDNKYIYVQCNFQGKISAGTKDPPLVHVYAIKFTNPDVDPQENLYNGKAVCNIPMAVSNGTTSQDEGSYWIKLMGSKEKFLKAQKTGTVFADIKDAFAQKSGTAFPNADFTSKADGTVLTAKVSRAAFGKNPSGYLRIVSFTCMNKSLTTLFPLFMNCSNFLVLYTSSQSYTVK